jgi:molybdenum cofactor biosynthesis protein B
MGRHKNKLLESSHSMEKTNNTREFIAMNIAVLTLSDTRTIVDDKSGNILVDRLQNAGHHLADRQMSKDDVDTIRHITNGWINDPEIDVILTTGGTGFTGRDVTVEAIEPLFEKKMDGFSTVFHQISFAKIGTSTVQSRATGGVANATYIFCLPGSPGACKDAWDGILNQQLDYRHMPCNFVEILPRLDEGLQRGK